MNERLQVIAALCVAVPCPAQTTGSANGSELPHGKWLEERGPQDSRPFERSDLLLGNGLLSPGYFETKNRLWIERGFAVGGYYSMNEQVDTSEGAWHGSGELLALASWEPLRRDDKVGRVVFGFAYDHKIGRTTREFADRLGIVEDPDDLDTGGEDTFATLGLLSWEQEFHLGPKTGWGFRAGQLFAASYFGIAHYLDDDRRTFLARPLAAAAGAQWFGDNDIGLGLNVIGWRRPFYASAAIMDAKAKRTWPDFSSLFDGELLYIGEVGYERDEGGPNHTAIRVTLSYIDLADGPNPEKGPGWAAAVTAVRRVGGRFAVFGRWTRSWHRRSSKYRELLSVGGAWTQPFGRSQDFLGLGFWVGHPSDAKRHSELGVELSYRIQLTQAVSVMPDAQYWVRDETGEDVNVLILGVRLNFEI